METRATKHYAEVYMKVFSAIHHGLPSLFAAHEVNAQWGGTVCLSTRYISKDIDWFLQ